LNLRPLGYENYYDLCCVHAGSYTSRTYLIVVLVASA
jgi:hypothetical protein